MKVHNLYNFIKGWFIGDFQPSCLQTDQFEVAVKHYTAGQSEQSHVHKIATEFTVVVSGEVIMNGQKYGPGTIIEIIPGKYTDFLAVSDAITVVVKTPSVKGDKYEAEAHSSQR